MRYKIFAAVLCAFSIIAMLFSCAQPKVEIDLGELYDAISAKFEMEDMLPMSENSIKNNFNFSEGSYVNLLCFTSSNPNSSGTFVLCEAADKKSLEDIEDILKEYKQYKLGEVKDYSANPDNEAQYYIIDGSFIYKYQNYIFFAIDSDNAKINKAIKSYIEESK